MRSLPLTILAVLAACSATSHAEPEPRTITFKDISSWPYSNRLEGIPAEVQALSGTRVTMAGVALPIDRDEEFLLVDPAAPWLNGPCREGPAMNSFVRVVLPKGRAANAYGGTVRCTGTFVASAAENDGQLTDIYQLHADLVEAHPEPARPPFER
jgi:hypothetical protein